MVTNQNNALLAYDTQLRGYVFRQLGTRYVEDVVQDVYVRYLKAGYSYHGSRLRNTLFTIAKNYISDNRPRWMLQERELSKEEDFQELDTFNPSTEPTPEQQVEKKEQSNFVHNKVDKLQDDWRDVILLRFHNGLSLKEIAKVVNKKASNVARIQSEALALLRKELVALVCEEIELFKPEWQTLIQLRFEQGLSIKKISMMTGKTVRDICQMESELLLFLGNEFNEKII